MLIYSNVWCCAMLAQPITENIAFVVYLCVFDIMGCRYFYEMAFACVDEVLLLTVGGGCSGSGWWGHTSSASRRRYCSGHTGHAEERRSSILHPEPKGETILLSRPFRMKSKNMFVYITADSDKAGKLLANYIKHNWCSSTIPAVRSHRGEIFTAATDMNNTF